MKKSAPAGPRAQKPDEKNGRSSATGSTPPPLETKPPIGSVETKEFTRRLKLIFSGHVTPLDELYRPLKEFDGESDGTMLLELKDAPEHQLTKELFSLWQSLNDQAKTLPIPRNISQVDDYKITLSLLERQAKLAEGLFWQHLRALIPEYAATGKIAVAARWFVFDPATNSPFEVFQGSEILDFFRRQHARQEG